MPTQPIQKSNILAVEDWRKIYRTFKNADFRSYDFESLRKAMIDYLRVHYPEDFNDFIESSEYVALIDLIAFLGQNLAYRTDLNTRENFLDTAERRDSILKLARLISYNPKRAICSSGFLKIETVSTTETLRDSDGVDIANVPIYWNDSTNDNWQEQFGIVLNAAMVDPQVIGKPGHGQKINGIQTDEYTLNLTTNTRPVFSYIATINGTRYPFEIVSATSIGESFVYEKPPRPTQLFNILYRNDNNGNSSNNTGFFLYFKQGELGTLNFNLSEALANRVINIEINNINNTDVWLYQNNPDGSIGEEWKQVPAISGVNIVYNKMNERNLYQVVTRANDQIDLVFGDGSFSNIPKGPFTLYYRTSTNNNYKITPEEMQGVRVSMDYVSRAGRVETLTIIGNLKYTVSNSTSRESIESIRQRAPQFYYTQNRMITGEDYNLFPYANYSNIIKVKAVNRTSSGVSRSLDVVDPTGKYSSTNIFANDGIFYKEDINKTLNVSFATITEANKKIFDTITNILNLKEILHFYYSHYPTTDVPDCQWKLVNRMNWESYGYFFDSTGNPRQLGYNTVTPARNIRVGSVIKFVSPSGMFFNAHNDLEAGVPRYDNEKYVIYATVMRVDGDGTANGIGEYTDGTAPVVLNIKVPSGAIVQSVIPALRTNLSPSYINELIGRYVEAFDTFGLSFNPMTQQWRVITVDNLSYDDFSLDNFEQPNDSSWMILFSYNGISYDVTYRITRYVFESEKLVKFYFDEDVLVYDSKIGKVIRDHITILKCNSKPDTNSPLEFDFNLSIHKNSLGSDGYVANNRIYVTYPDSNLDGQPDNPYVFDDIVAPSVNPLKKLLFFKIIPTDIEFTKEEYVDSALFVTMYETEQQIRDNIMHYPIGQLFYINETKQFYKIVEDSSRLRLLENVTSEYVARVGRDKLHFRYQHNSPNYRRIDPSPVNIVDLYILTKRYDEDYRRWIQDTTSTVNEPVPPTNEDLAIEFSGIEKYKPVSDTIIYNTVKYKPLFGSKADPSLQATFKVVKNPNVLVSDNDVKSKMILEINNYFSINNKDLGETFYFSELSAYLHSKMVGMISSVILTPKSADGYFGDLFQVSALPGEILISCATVEDIEIINAVTLSAITNNRN